MKDVDAFLKRMTAEMEGRTGKIRKEEVDSVVDCLSKLPMRQMIVLGNAVAKYVVSLGLTDLVVGLGGEEDSDEIED